MSSTYTEEPLTNDTYFSSEWDNLLGILPLLGSLGMGKYGGSREHSFHKSHYSAIFYGLFLPVESRITEMIHR